MLAMQKLRFTTPTIRRGKYFYFPMENGESYPCPMRMHQVEKFTARRNLAGLDFVYLNTFESILLGLTEYFKLAFPGRKRNKKLVKPLPIIIAGSFICRCFTHKSVGDYFQLNGLISFIQFPLFLKTRESKNSLKTPQI